MRATLAPLLCAILVGCGSSSSSDNPSDTGAPDTGAPTDTGTDDTADAAGGPLSLKPGEVAEIANDGSTGGVRLATPNGDEQYVLVIASMKLDLSARQLAYSVATDGAPDGASASVVTGCSLTSDAWASKPLPTETPPSGTAPAVGTTKTIHMPTDTGVEDIDVQVIAVGKSAVVWGDITPAHPAGMDATFVSTFLGDFENTILPRERTVFGMESDADGDGHIQLVFTPLTYKTAVAFFTGCDLLASMPGCVTSNGGEYLYLTPPASIAPPYNTPNAIKEILSHECSHLVHFNRKVLRNALTDWTDSGYMIEGAGALAQDAVGPQAGNLYVTMAGLDGIENYSLGNTLVDGAPYVTTRDGVLRGGSYLFVRWLYDRAGGDQANVDGTVTSKGGPAFWRTLLDAPQSIAKLLPTTTKSPIEDLGMDFYTTLAMSNRDESPAGGVPPTNACFSYLPTSVDPVTGNQRGADVFAKFHGMQMKGPAVQKTADGKIIAGGVEYVEVDATSGSPELDLTVTVDAQAKPRIRIGRIH